MQAAVREIGSAHGAAAERPGLRLRAAHYWIQRLVSLAGRAPGAARVIRPAGVLFAWTFGHAMREGTLANAARILGHGGSGDAGAVRKLARSMVGTFYDFLMDMGRHGERAPAQILEEIDGAEGVEQYLEARRAGRGAIIVTAHIGSFEVGAAAMREREPSVHVVFQRDPIQLFERLRREQHQRLGLIETPVDPGAGGDTWTVWLKLRDALRENHVVLMQGDRVMPGQRGRKVPFMGGHIMLPPGPVKLALATGAPIIPVCSPRLKSGKVRIVMEEPIWVNGEDSAASGPHPAELRLAKVIEGWVRRYPEQWMMIHKAWCEDQA